MRNSGSIITSIEHSEIAEPILPPLNDIQEAYGEFSDLFCDSSQQILDVNGQPIGTITTNKEFTGPTENFIQIDKPIDNLTHDEITTAIDALQRGWGIKFTDETDLTSRLFQSMIERMTGETLEVAEEDWLCGTETPNDSQILAKTILKIQRLEKSGYSFDVVASHNDLGVLESYVNSSPSVTNDYVKAFVKGFDGYSDAEKYATSISKSLDNPKIESFLVVIRDKMGNVVSSGCLSIFQHKGERYGYSHGDFTVPEATGNGLQTATILIRQILAESRWVDPTHSFAYVEPGSTSGINYHRSNFVTVGTARYLHT